MILAATLLTCACRREEKIKLEPTDESSPGLASTVHAADPKAAIQLVRGFHAVEQNAWRWTMGRFAVTFEPPAGAAERGARVSVKFSLPDAVLQKVKKTTLTASIQNTRIGSQTYTAPGDSTFNADVPGELLKGGAVTVEFALDSFLPGSATDGRELGIVFVSAAMDPK